MNFKIQKMVQSQNTEKHALLRKKNKDVYIFVT